MKRVEIDGKFYRYRRGKLVEIPSGWVGRVTTPATIRRRPSKMTGKLAREQKYSFNSNYKDREAEITSKLAETEIE